MKLRLPTNPFCRILTAAVMTALLLASPSPTSAEITDEELGRFVRGYLSAAQQATPDAEVNHYAKKVRYFTSGTVDQSFIAEDQRRYYKTWPERSFELLDGPVTAEQEGDAATVRFTIRYNVRAAGRKASGMTENTMGVKRFEDGLKIVSLSERKVKSGDLPKKTERSVQESPPAKGKTSTATTPSKPADLPGATVPAKKSEAPQTAAIAPKAAPEKATPIPEAPGFVYPPGTEQTSKNMLDVRGYAPGQKVRDPRTGLIFLVP